MYPVLVTCQCAEVRRDHDCSGTAAQVRAPTVVALVADHRGKRRTWSVYCLG